MSWLTYWELRRLSGTSAGGSGYSVCTNRRGDAIATELVAGLIVHAAAAGVRRLVAHTRPDNAASIALLRRNGFVEVATEPDGLVLFSVDLAPA